MLQREDMIVDNYDEEEGDDDIESILEKPRSRRPARRSRSRSRSPKRDDERSRSGKSGLLEITTVQLANGSWKASDVRDILKVSMDKISWVYPSGSSFIAEEILATALVIAYIQWKFPEEEKVWKMVVHKARLFIINGLSKSLKKAEAVEFTQKLITVGTDHFQHNK